MIGILDMDEHSLMVEIEEKYIQESPSYTKKFPYKKIRKINKPVIDLLAVELSAVIGRDEEERDIFFYSDQLCLFSERQSF